jgi:serine/threonine-protein kinase
MSSFASSNLAYDAVPGSRGNPARLLWELWRQGRPPEISDFLIQAGRLGLAQLVAVLRVDQRQRWLHGDRITVEDYLRQLPALAAEPLHALDLIYSEFLLREELGESPAVEEYARRFPAFADELHLQVELHRAVTPSRTAQPPATLAGPCPDPHFPVVPDYELLEVIGRGGMGVVYRARQSNLNRTVALKMILAWEHLDAEQLTRFRAEAQAIARLQHPNIVQIHEVGEYRDWPYFSMEFLEGGSLDRQLGGRPQPAQQAAVLVRILAGAMHAAHQRGVVHRDLKPGNVLLAADGTPKISDFGLAKMLDGPAGQTQTGAILGTPSYMAPEQARGQNREIGPAVDVYALGAILYELLTGRPPFLGLTVLETLGQVCSIDVVPPHRLQPRVPRDLETICLKCLRKEIGERYPTAAALAEDLQRFLSDQPIKARPVRWHERLARWCRRNPVLTGLAALLVVMLLAGNALVTWKWQEAEQARQAERQSRQEADDRAAEIREGLERMKAANALLERSATYRDLGAWDNAEADLTRAIRLRPEDPRVWMERAHLYTRLGLWELAAPDVARSFALQEPAVPWNYHMYALLRLHAGDAPGYREFCARMRERFAGTKQIGFATSLVRTCALAPDPDGDPTWLVELGQSIAAVDPTNAWIAYVAGVAHYRAGHYEQAVQNCRRSFELNPIWQLQAVNGPILAMAHYHLGQGRAAHEALDEAAKARERAVREMYQAAVGFWSIGWWDWLESQLHDREARELLGLPPPPDDPRIHFLRGRALSHLQRRTEAAAEFDAARRLGLKDQTLRSVAHRNQGHYHVRHQEWAKAHAEFAQAVAAAPEDADLWQSLALAHQAAGSVEGYHQVCADMRRRLAHTTDPETAGLVVLTCALTPAAATDPAALVALARIAGPWEHGSVRCLGAALYRAGQYEEAVDCFRAAARLTRPAAREWLFLTMAHARLGQHEEARRCLARADNWVVQANLPDTNDLSGTRPRWNRWFERTEVEVLRREAMTLLGNGR